MASYGISEVPYEEGTWTPVLTFATAGDLARTYTTQTGSYERVGSLVLVRVHILTATFTHTTASGNARITGLPFAVGTGAVCGLGAWGGVTKANYTDVGLQAVAGQSYLQLYASGSAQAAANLAAADMPTTGAVLLIGEVLYRI